MRHWKLPCLVTACLLLLSSLNLANDIAPTSLEVSASLPALIDGQYVPPVQDSLADHLLDTAIAHIQKTTQANVHLKGYVQVDKEGEPTGHVLLVYEGTQRPLEITVFSDCPVNSQFDVDAKFTLAASDVHAYLPETAEAYDCECEECLSYNPPWLVPLCATWTKMRHWPERDCLISDYVPTLGGTRLDISYNRKQVDQYERYVLLQSAIAAVD